ncbi:TetR/AcrR family transcriptional regulator [Streptomyces sp. ACA25]|uniref:TetR/AcrR family transcriptional regulator n=1 Tax=Streptomyces sp. ACA25 TaxID=3022596 RepID=UPI002306F2BD|nr:TetR/AcrR family transcriptional regulator [Streptomyces sp. ACA25]MDB1088050.1 TetR/AcrR family transcriptional regulator [Streptomyces sp. ACA25]
MAITDIRQRLFEAAERLLVREGAAGLTNRAIAEEAGCSKGVLYNHFADLDDFAAQLVLNLFAEAAESVRELPGRVGRDTVAGNVGAVALVLLRPQAPAVAALALTRATVSSRVRQAMADGAPGLPTVEAALATYLEAEKERGRVPEVADSQALALAVTGTAHHLIMTAWDGAPDPRARITQLVGALFPQ